MSDIIMMENWLALYNNGLGLTDSPTRGLIGELLFRELMPTKIKDNLAKGTFEIDSHSKNKETGSQSRKSKYQFDWLLLNKPAPELSSLIISGIPFGVFKHENVLAVIEIKAGDYLGSNYIQDDIFATKCADHALGKKWVYITFGESNSAYTAFKKLELDLSKINNAGGKYFCLYGAGIADQVQLTLDNLKEVTVYLNTLLG